MTRLRLGVALESLGLPVRAALDAAARLTLDGVQLDAVGPLAPDALTGTGRREFRALLRGHLLDLTAINCPLRRGLDNPEDLAPRLDHLRKVAQLAVDLGAPRLVLPLPALPREDEVARAATMRDALEALATAGDRTGVSVALTPGADKPAAVRDYLNTFDSGSLRVNYDPAGALAAGHPAGDALTALGPLLDHVRGRDVRKLAGGEVQETAAGSGDVDWVLTVALLEAAGYRGTLTVAPAGGSAPTADARAGVQFLRRFVPPPRR